MALTSDNLNLESGLPELIFDNYSKFQSNKVLTILNTNTTSYHINPQNDTFTDVIINYYKKYQPEFNDFYENNKINVFIANGSIQLYLLFILTCQQLLKKTLVVYMKKPYFYIARQLVDQLENVIYTNNYKDADLEILVSPNNPDGKKLKPSISKGKFLLIDSIYNNFNYLKHPYWYNKFYKNYTTIITSSASKLFGLAAQRVGWAFISDTTVYENMVRLMELTTTGYNGYSTPLIGLSLEDVNINEFKMSYNELVNRYYELSKILKRYNIKIKNEPGRAYAWMEFTSCKCDLALFFTPLHIKNA
jgi:histidinol-phosphate/aromatic aminotransferase/cobyric acid decarboxylase-like protein